MQIDLIFPELKIVTPAGLAKLAASQPQSPLANQSLSPSAGVRLSKFLTSSKQRTYPLSLGGRAEHFDQVEALRQSLNEYKLREVRRPARRVQLSVEIPRTYAVPESPAKLPELRLRDLNLRTQKTPKLPSLPRPNLSPKSRFRLLEVPKLRSRLAKSTQEQEAEVTYHYRAVTFGDKLERIQRLAARALRELKEIQP